MTKKNGSFNKKALIDQLKDNSNQAQVRAQEHIKQHFTCLGYQMGIADVLKLLEDNDNEEKKEKKPTA